MNQTNTPQNSYSLAFETSCEIGSVTLGNGDALLETRRFSAPRKHASEFLPTTAEICKAHGVTPSDIQHVFVSAGPGSFTGLRIGITAARMIALATSAKIVAVPTLLVVAHNALEMSSPPTRLIVILDAQRSRVYAEAFEYREDKYVSLGAPAEVEPAEFFSQQAKQCAVTGQGIDQHQDAVNQSSLEVLPQDLWRPRSEIVYQLGLALAKCGVFTEGRDLIPTYIRKPDAEEKWAER